VNRSQSLFLQRANRSCLHFFGEQKEREQKIKRAKERILTLLPELIYCSYTAVTTTATTEALPFLL